MSLFGDIMNIQTGAHVEDFPQECRLSFNNGHKAARHEAAELALTYENLVDTLERELECMQTYVDSVIILDHVDEMLGAIRKVKSGEYK